MLPAISGASPGTGQQTHQAATSSVVKLSIDGWQDGKRKPNAHASNEQPSSKLPALPALRKGAVQHGHKPKNLHSEVRQAKAPGTKQQEADEDVHAKDQAKTLQSLGTARNAVDAVERRKALAQGAFVRHSTKDMMDHLQAVNTAQESQGQQVTILKKESSSKPLKLPMLRKSISMLHFTPDRPEDEQDLPTASNMSSSSAPAATTSTPHHQQQPTNANGDSIILPHSQKPWERFLPKIPGTLNGIGHPVLPHYHHYEVPKPVFVVTSVKPPDSHHMLEVLRGEASGTGEGDDGEADQDGSQDGSAGPGAPAQAPRKKSIAKPQASQDEDDFLPAKKQAPMFVTGSLDVWRGKRLNKFEAKVEQRVVMMHANPVARSQLEARVKMLTEQRHLEHMAIAKAAQEKDAEYIEKMKQQHQVPRR